MSGRAWGELILLSVIWGGVFLAVRVALDEIGVITSVAHRLGWAAIVLWLIVWWRRLPVPRGAQVWLAFAVMGVLNNALPFALLAWAQTQIETGLTAILNATTALFGVLVAAALLPDEPLTRARLIGVSIGTFGVATAIGLDTLAAFDPRAVAQLAVLGATLSYALASVWAKKQLTGVAPLVAAAGMVTAAAAMAIPAALWVEGPVTFDLRVETWAAIAYAALLATVGAYLLYFRVLAMAGSGNLMLCTLLIPPIAITLGALVRMESLPTRAFAGFALIALGLVVIDGRLWRRLRLRTG